MGGGTAEIRALQDAFGRLTWEIERLQRSVTALELRIAVLEGAKKPKAPEVVPLAEFMAKTPARKRGG